MRGPYAIPAAGISRPRFTSSDEARSTRRRSSDRYDVLAITVVDSFAALTAGAYALTENYLYTEEAMLDFLGHLSPDGVIAMTRWYRDPPSEIARTVGIADGALRRLGRDQPARGIAVLRHGLLGLVLTRNEPFTATDMQRLRAFADAHGFSIAHPSPSRRWAVGPLVDRPPDDGTHRPTTRPFFRHGRLTDILAGLGQLPYG